MYTEDAQTQPTQAKPTFTAPHTPTDGQPVYRFAFDGRAMDLLLIVLKNIFLTIITFGVYFLPKNGVKPLDLSMGI